MGKNIRNVFLKGLNLLILIVFALICFYPLYFVFINSFSSASAITKGVYLLPQKPTLIYYRYLLLTPSILQSTFISIARTVLGTIITVMCSSFMGYMVSRRDLPFHKIIYRYFIITMYFGAGLIPKNNFLLYIIPGAVSAYYMILVKTYIESLPPSLEESAEIDGAGIFTIFFRIILPLSLPIVACITVFCAVGQWNAWSDNLYLVSEPKLDTLQYLLYKSLQQNMTNVSSGKEVSTGPVSQIEITPAGLQYAMTVVTVIPIMLVYPFMQKYFVKGLMLGAIKG